MLTEPSILHPDTTTTSVIGDALNQTRLAINLFVSFVAAATALEASATLQDRGRGLIFDSVLGITWMQDANIPRSDTLGLVLGDSNRIYSDGHMNWTAANLYVARMNELNYLGYDNWRLPQIRPTLFGYDLRCVSYDGSSECGYNINDTRNELAHLFYSSLANQSSYDINGNPNSPPPIAYRPFLTVSNSRYWTGNGLPPLFGPGQAFSFDFSSGLKEWDSKYEPYYKTFVWAVRDGDVSSIPETGTFKMMLFGAVLLLLGSLRTPKS